MGRSMAGCVTPVTPCCLAPPAFQITLHQGFDLGQDMPGTCPAIASKPVLITEADAVKARKCPAGVSVHVWHMHRHRQWTRQVVPPA